MYYNFGRVHQTLRVTPAMEAGIADHVWSIDEIVGLLDDWRRPGGNHESQPMAIHFDRSAPSGHHLVVSCHNRPEAEESSYVGASIYEMGLPSLGINGR